MAVRKNNKAENLLTLREACLRLNCHPNTLRRWDKNGQLAAVHLGSRGDRRYVKKEIERLLEQKSNNYKVKGSSLESKVDYEFVVNQSPDLAILMTNKEGMVVSWSKGAEKLIGLKSKRISDRHFSIIYLPQDREKKLPQKDLAKAQKEGKLESEGWMMGKFNRLFWAEMTIIPLTGRKKEIIGHSVIIKDSSDKKKAQEALEQSENRYQGLVESQTDMIVRTTPEGKFTFVNNAYCRTFNKKREELLGKSFVPLIHPKDRKPTLTAMQKLKTPPYRVRIEQRAMTRQGWRWISWEDCSVVDSKGRVVEIQGVGRDIHESKVAQESLKFSERSFRKLADSMPQLVWTADGDGKVDYYNRRAYEYNGLYKDSDGAWKWEPILHPDDRDKTVRAWNLALKRGRVYEIEHRVKKKDGNYYWHLSRGLPLKSETGEVKKWYGTATDIHHQKVAAESIAKAHDQLKAILNTIDDGVLVYDPEGKILFVNGQGIKIPGFTNEDEVIHSRGIKDYVRKLYRINEVRDEKGQPFLPGMTPGNRVLAGEPQAQTLLQFKSKRDGTVRWVNSCSKPVLDGRGKIVMAVTVISDVTHQKKLENQKDEFLAVASHELKTPLTSIKAYAQVLEKMFERDGDLRSAQFLAKMNTQVDKLTMLINDLLDITRIESGKLMLRPAWFDPDSLVREMVEEMQRTTDKHKVTVSGSCRKMVWGDRDRTGQVVTNLLANAIKFSPHSENIRVTIEKEKNRIIVCVKDNGIGIPKDKLDKIFSRFYRVSGTKEDTFPGLGLGLYIAQEIISRQEGALWAESEVGKGSTFCFSLPLDNRPNGIR